MEFCEYPGGCHVSDLEKRIQELEGALKEIMQLTPSFGYGRDDYDQEYEFEYFEADEVRKIAQTALKGEK